MSLFETIFFLNALTLSLSGLPRQKKREIFIVFFRTNMIVMQVLFVCLVFPINSRVEHYIA